MQTDLYMGVWQPGTLRYYRQREKILNEFTKFLGRLSALEFIKNTENMCGKEFRSWRCPMWYMMMMMIWWHFFLPVLSVMLKEGGVERRREKLCIFIMWCASGQYYSRTIYLWHLSWLESFFNWLSAIMPQNAISIIWCICNNLVYYYHFFFRRLLQFYLMKQGTSSWVQMYICNLLWCNGSNVSS